MQVDIMHLDMRHPMSALRLHIKKVNYDFTYSKIT